MTKIALWIRVCADAWSAESAIKASNDLTVAITASPIPTPSLTHAVPRDKQWQVPRDTLAFLPASFLPRAAGQSEKVSSANQRTNQRKIHLHKAATNLFIIQIVYDRIT